MSVRNTLIKQLESRKIKFIQIHTFLLDNLNRCRRYFSQFDVRYRRIALLITHDPQRNGQAEIAYALLTGRYSSPHEIEAAALSPDSL